MSTADSQVQPRVRIGSLAVSNLTWWEATRRVEELIASEGADYALTPNVDHVVQAESDPYLRRIYADCPLVLADGMPLIWASRFLGTPLKEKISGSDFLAGFGPVAARQGYRLFFLGGKDDAVEISAAILQKRFPGLRVVGTCSPPMGFENSPAASQQVIEAITSAAPDLIFVGLGTPKQEKWIYENRRHHRVPLSFPVGAGFDFLSGKSRRAPVWMRRSGLEWLWRLAQEPGRLSGRYLVRDLRFLPIILRQKRKGASHLGRVNHQI